MNRRPSTTQLESWWTAHAKASEDWHSRAGVVHVGLGAKEQHDRITDQVALLFYVKEKKPASELSAEEVIPKTILGVKTDVQRCPEWHEEEFGATNLDGGDQIRAVPDDRDRPKPGTLGYIATKTPGNENVMLSCDHVMIPNGRSDNRIFHPDVSRCCGKLKNAVGVATQGRRGRSSHTNSQGSQMYVVDCAFATIDDGVNGRKHIPGAGNVTGSGDISDDPTPITVVKRGAVTGVTKGTVTDIDFDPRPGGSARLISVRPLAGHTTPFEKDFTVPNDEVMQFCLTQYPLRSRGGTATQIGDNKVRFNLPAFTVPGDSGAVLVDDSSRAVVGMIFSGDVFTFPGLNEEGRLGTSGMPAGDGWACHIQPVLGELGLRIDPSTAPSSRPAAILTPGDAIDAAPPEPGKLDLINERLAALEDVLETTDKGRLLNNLVRHHADELMNLVHHRRKVLVQWHRSKGPGFAALLLDALVEEETPIPEMVGDVHRDTLLRRMRDVLAVEGSLALQDAIRRHEKFLFELLSESRTVGELVSALK